MRLYALFAMFTLSVCPVVASQYAGVNVGTNNSIITNESHDPKIGYQLGAVYGYKFDNGFRTEFALGYKKNNFKNKYTTDGKDDLISSEYRSIHSFTYMLNGFYDLSQLKVMEATPYVGLGFGYGQNTEENKLKTDANVNRDKFRDNRFAYQAIAGVRYDLNANYSTAFEYHYCSSRSHCKDHSVTVSVLRNF